jgi:hypothetical protein
MSFSKVDKKYLLENLKTTLFVIKKYIIDTLLIIKKRIQIIDFEHCFHLYNYLFPSILHLVSSYKSLLSKI